MDVAPIGIKLSWHRMSNGNDSSWTRLKKNDRFVAMIKLLYNVSSLNLTKLIVYGDGGSGALKTYFSLEDFCAGNEELYTYIKKNYKDMWGGTSLFSKKTYLCGDIVKTLRRELDSKNDDVSYNGGSEYNVNCFLSKNFGDNFVKSLGHLSEVPGLSVILEQRCILNQQWQTLINDKQFVNLLKLILKYAISTASLAKLIRGSYEYYTTIWPGIDHPLEKCFRNNEWIINLLTSGSEHIFVERCFGKYYFHYLQYDVTNLLFKVFNLNDEEGVAHSQEKICKFLAEFFSEDFLSQPLNLSGLDLSGCDLSNAKLNGADLRWTKLSGAILAGADMSMCKVWHTNFNNISLHNDIIRLMQKCSNNMRDYHTVVQIETFYLTQVVYCEQIVTIKEYIRLGKEAITKYWQIFYKTVEANQNISNFDIFPKELIYAMGIQLFKVYLDEMVKAINNSAKSSKQIYYNSLDDLI